MGDSDLIAGGDWSGRSRLPRFPRWLLAVGVGTVLVGSGLAGLVLTAGGRPRTHATLTSRPTPVASPRSSPLPGIPFVDVDGGYHRSETFCADAPLGGRIEYRLIGRRVTLVVRLSGLPHDAGLEVDWINMPAAGVHYLRGYTIAYVHTDAAGKVEQDTLRMFRGGETRGHGLALAAATDTGTLVGQLHPCA